jgi:hypothetical protein
MNLESMEIDPKIKKEINEEGWEGDAAVLIGTEEEMPLLRQRLESEGMTENLETYIKLNKRISLPINSSYLAGFHEGEKVKNELKSMIGQGCLSIFEGGNSVLHYIDKEGNYCKVGIVTDKIAELKGREMTEDMFRKLGFDISDKFSKNIPKLNAYAQEHNSREEYKEEERKKENFNF